MARRPSKHLRPARPLSASFARSDAKADGRWVVQGVPPGASAKTYTCPGCNHDVAVGTSHIVAWPHEPSLGSTSPLDERRHWHTTCWNRRR